MNKRRHPPRNGIQHSHCEHSRHGYNWITTYIFYPVDRFSPASFSRSPSSRHWRKQISNATTPEALEIVLSLSRNSALMSPVWLWARRYRLDLFISLIWSFPWQIKGNTGVSHCFDDSGFTCTSSPLFRTFSGDIKPYFDTPSLLRWPNSS